MKGCSLPEQTTKKKTLLFLPGPEFDNEACGCQQFHFMPRFVRFLPGETLNRTCPAFFFHLSPCDGQWWHRAPLKMCNRKEKGAACLQWCPNISAYAGVDVCGMFSAKWYVDFQRLSCCVAAWYSFLIHMMVLVHYDIATVFVMTAVPPTFFPSKNNFSPSSPNLVRYKHLSASFTKAHKKKLSNTMFLMWSVKRKRVRGDRELRWEHDDGVFESYSESVWVCICYCLNAFPRLRGQ